MTFSFVKIEESRLFKYSENYLMLNEFLVTDKKITVFLRIKITLLINSD